MTSVPNRQKEIILYIKQLIASGQYDVGDRLPSEAELAEKFNVARSVVREAASVLKAEGRIEARRGRNGGFVVANRGFDVVIDRLMDLLLAGKITLRQAADVRLKLEVDSCRAGTANVTDETVAKLRALDAAMLNSKDKSEHTRLNAEFHACIGMMGGNKLQGILLVMLLQFVGKASEILTDDVQSMHSVDEHIPIIQSIEARDVESACHYLTEHISKAVNRLESAEKDLLTKKIHASFARGDIIQI